MMEEPQAPRSPSRCKERRLDQALRKMCCAGNFDAVWMLLSVGASDVRNCINISINYGHYKITTLLLVCEAVLTDDRTMLENLLSGNVDFKDLVKFLREFATYSKIRRHLQNKEEFTTVAIKVASTFKKADIIQCLLLHTHCERKEGKVEWKNLQLENFHDSWLEIIQTWVCDLNLSGNNMPVLPAVLVNMKLITRLNLSNNKLKEISSELFTMHNLRNLNISRNHLSKLPELPEFKVALRSLNVSYNELKDLPESIARSFLEILNLSYNLFTEVPLCVCDVITLKDLDLSGNREISCLPDVMGKLRNLYNLGLKSLDKLTDLPNGSQHVVSTLRARLRACQRYYTMKLMLVGKSDQGKTALLHALQDDMSYTSNGLTQGVEISDLVIKKNAFDKKFTFKVWDFGGQEDYYATHQCFLSTMSLYLLVWRLIDGEEGVNGLIPWLDNIAVRSPRSTVIIVGTYLDCISPDKYEANYVENLKYMVNNLARKQRYRGKIIVPPQGVCAISCVEGTSKNRNEIIKLRHIIYDTAAGLKKQGAPVMGELIPCSFFTLIERIEKRKMEMLNKKQPPIIKREEFKAMVEENSRLCKKDIQDPHDVRDATVFLRERGIIIHFDDPNDGLSNLYFIDPRWLCSLMARVVKLKSQPDLVKEGILIIENTHELFKDQFPDEFRPQIIRLFISFQAAYSLDKSRLLIPSTLPDNKPTEVENLLLPFVPVRRCYKIDYQQIHGFQTRFMSRLFSYMKEMIAMHPVCCEKPNENQHNAKFCSTCALVDSSSGKFPCFLEKVERAKTPVKKGSRVITTVASEQRTGAASKLTTTGAVEPSESCPDCNDPTVKMFSEDELLGPMDDDDDVIGIIINDVKMGTRSGELSPVQFQNGYLVFKRQGRGLSTTSQEESELHEAVQAVEYCGDNETFVANYRGRSGVSFDEARATVNHGAASQGDGKSKELDQNNKREDQSKKTQNKEHGPSERSEELDQNNKREDQSKKTPNKEHGLSGRSEELDQNNKREDQSKKTPNKEYGLSGRSEELDQNNKREDQSKKTPNKEYGLSGRSEELDQNNKREDQSKKTPNKEHGPSGRSEELDQNNKREDQSKKTPNKEHGPSGRSEELDQNNKREDQSKKTQNKEYGLSGRSEELDQNNKREDQSKKTPNKEYGLSGRSEELDQNNKREDQSKKTPNKEHGLSGRSEELDQNNKREDQSKKTPNKEHGPSGRSEELDQNNKREDQSKKTPNKEYGLSGRSEELDQNNKREDQSKKTPNKEHGLSGRSEELDQNNKREDQSKKTPNKEHGLSGRSEELDQNNKREDQSKKTPNKEHGLSGRSEELDQNNKREDQSKKTPNKEHGPSGRSEELDQNNKREDQSKKTPNKEHGLSGRSDELDQNNKREDQSKKTPNKEHGLSGRSEELDQNNKREDQSKKTPNKEHGPSGRSEELDQNNKREDQSKKTPNKEHGLSGRSDELDQNNKREDQSKKTPNKEYGPSGRSEELDQNNKREDQSKKTPNKEHGLSGRSEELDQNNKREDQSKKTQNKEHGISGRSEELDQNNKGEDQSKKTQNKEYGPSGRSEELDQNNKREDQSKKTPNKEYGPSGRSEELDQNNKREDQSKNSQDKEHGPSGRVEVLDQNNKREDHGGKYSQEDGPSERSQNVQQSNKSGEYGSKFQSQEDGPSERYEEPDQNNKNGYHRRESKNHNDNNMVSKEQVMVTNKQLIPTTDDPHSMVKQLIPTTDDPHSMVKQLIPTTDDCMKSVSATKGHVSPNQHKRGCHVTKLNSSECKERYEMTEMLSSNDLLNNNYDDGEKIEDSGTENSQLTLSDIKVVPTSLQPKSDILDVKNNPGRNVNPRDLSSDTDTLTEPARTDYDSANPSHPKSSQTEETFPSGEVAMETEKCSLCNDSVPAHQLVTIPLGVTELLENNFLKCWRSGICLNHPNVFLGVSCVSLPSTIVIQTAVSPSPLGRRLLTLVVDHLDTLIKEWYPGVFISFGTQPSLQKVIPCRLCEENRVAKPHEFTFDTCVTQYSASDYVKCPQHVISIGDIAPDVVLHDLDSRLLVDEKDIQYDKTNLLGRGAYGTVYRGFFRGEPVAIKEFSGRFSGQLEEPMKQYNEIRKEVNVIGHIGQHPFLVNLMGVCLRPFRLVMELACKGSLSNTLTDPSFFIDRIVVYRMIHQVSDALGFLHSLNVIYRDLKPGNVLVMSYDKQDDINIKLTDFGTASFQFSEGLNSLQGTPGHLAPEMLTEFSKRSGYNDKVDIFSLGMLIYSFITRRKPFSNISSVAKINDMVCQGEKPKYDDIILSRVGLVTLTWLMEKCLQFDPNLRPTSREIADQACSPSFQLLLGTTTLPGTQSVHHVCMVEATRELWVAVGDNKNNTVFVYELNGMTFKTEFTVPKITPSGPFLAFHVNCMHVTRTSVLIGVCGDMELVAIYDIETYRQKVKVLLREHVCSLGSNEEYIFLGMPSGLLCIIPTRSDQKPETVQVSERPITSIMAVEDYLWLTVGHTIFIYNTKPGTYTDPFEVQAIRYSVDTKAIHITCANQQKIWCACKNSSVVSCWDAVERRELYRIDCDVAVRCLLADQIFTPLLRATCVVAALDTVWIGTNGGLILIFDAQSSELLTWMHFFDDSVRTLTLVSEPGPYSPENSFMIASGSRLREEALTCGGNVVCYPEMEERKKTKVKTTRSKKTGSMRKIHRTFSTLRRKKTKDSEHQTMGLLLLLEVLPANVLRRVETKSTR